MNLCKMTFSEFTWLHSPNHWALHFRELEREQPCNVCVAISEVKQPTQTRAPGFWAHHHHLSVGGLREGYAVLGVVPIEWSLPEPIHYTQTAQKEPNLPGHWEQHSCTGRASCPNTARFQGGSLGTSTWHNTAYMQISYFRVRVLE